MKPKSKTQRSSAAREERRRKYPKGGGPQPGAGAKPKEIDLKLVENLYSIHCTDDEVAAVLQVSRVLLHRRKQDPEFLEIVERGRAKGRVSLRRWQTDGARKGNPTLLIWLGKQILGQRNYVYAEHQISTVKQENPELVARIANDAEFRDVARRAIELMAERPGNAGDQAEPGPLETSEAPKAAGRLVN